MGRIDISESKQRELFVDGNTEIEGEYYCEVPVFSRSVDLVIHSVADNTITAVEFKLNNWKKAVEQALNVAICFDFIEICVPKPKTDKGTKSIVEYCGSYGIGVYFQNIESNEISHTVLPRRVERVWETQKMQVIDYLRRQQNELTA